MPSFKLPETKHVLLEVPAPSVLLMTMNREKQMNALTIEACWEMDRVWKWMDECDDMYAKLLSFVQRCINSALRARRWCHLPTSTNPPTKPPRTKPLPSRIAILTGAGRHSCSSGMDLKERLTFTSTTPASQTTFPPTGFGGLTRRVGLKPIIAAVNGHAHGGGFELALNADLVFASPNATFRLPDVLRGTAALQGALPRLVRTLGMQRAGLVALTGYRVGAEEAREWGLVVEVVEDGDVVERAVEVASAVARDCSPDSIVATRAGLREAWETGCVERATQAVEERWGGFVYGGENLREGIRAFVEKRRPVWGPFGGRSRI